MVGGDLEGMDGAGAVQPSAPDEAGGGGEPNGLGSQRAITLGLRERLANLLISSKITDSPRQSVRYEVESRMRGKQPR